MNISELGEFGLIERINALVSEAANDNSDARKNLIIGIGDDAAAWHADRSVQLATSDTMVQDIHFKLDFTSFDDLGWRALAANLSDIAAMGGLPRYVLVSLSMPGSTGVDDVLSLYRGMIALLNQSGAVIAGGNLTGAPVIMITITVLGSMSGTEDRLLTRSSAVPGDAIAVTGCPGMSRAGLEILKQHRSDTASRPLRDAFLRPVPRLHEGQMLVRHGVKTAIDISDGLIADLTHICEASNVGARIKADLVPVHPAAAALFPEKALEYALSGGEDYELLFTAPEGVMKQVEAALDCPVTVIGNITAAKPGTVTVIDFHGNEIHPETSGWKHFIREEQA
jgi:thiamine-monophosphate kinase